MVRRPLLLSAFVPALTCLWGCDQTFDPHAAFEKKLVVFSILTTRSDTQYVRVSSTYAVPGGVTADSSTSVSDAAVTITQGDRLFRFHDTTLVRTGAAGIVSRTRVYVGYSFAPVQGQPCVLTVLSPSAGNVTARGVSLYRGSLHVENWSGPRAPASDISVRVILGPNAGAFIVRSYLDYEILGQAGWVPQRIEVPMGIRADTREYVYPKPLPRTESGIVFGAAPYRDIIARLNSQFPEDSLRLRKVEFVLTEMDDAFYAYYSSVNAFIDAGTLRLDEPDYTNIQGGYGVFGMSAESVTAVIISQNGAAQPR